MKKKYTIGMCLILTGISFILFSSCETETESSIELADLTTNPIKFISESAACCGGIIDTNGGSFISKRGVCWGLDPSPTIDNNFTEDIMEDSGFTSCITGLNPNTTYYVRAYAKNGAGFGYGNEISFTTMQEDIEFNPDINYGTVSDFDGNVYRTTEIGSQTWMAENLRAIHYQNGDVIGSPLYDNECYVAKYGRLYLWYETADSRNVCPEGWHIPSFSEWMTLENYLIDNGFNYDGSTTDNKIAKSLASDIGWNSSTFEGSVGNIDYHNMQNMTGFTAIGGGLLGDGYSRVGEWGCWWTSSDLSEPNGWGIFMDNENVNAMLNGLGKNYGLSARCLKD